VKLQPSTDVNVVMLSFVLMRHPGDTPLYSHLKVIAVPVLATILHMAPYNKCECLAILMELVERRMPPPLLFILVVLLVSLTHFF